MIHPTSTSRLQNILFRSNAHLSPIDNTPIQVQFKMTLQNHPTKLTCWLWGSCTGFCLAWFSAAVKTSFKTTCLRQGTVRDANILPSNTQLQQQSVWRQGCLVLLLSAVACSPAVAVLAAELKEGGIEGRQIKRGIIGGKRQKINNNNKK